MANKRMFRTSIINNDKFMLLSSGARLLYFILGLSADDFGICDNTISCLHKAQADVECLQELEKNGYIYVFQCDDVHYVVLRQWNQNNTIRKDRITPTLYPNIYNMLDVDDDKTYVLKKEGMGSDSQPDDNQVLTEGQRSIVENNIVEDSIDKIDNIVNSFTINEVLRKDIFKFFDMLSIKDVDVISYHLKRLAELSTDTNNQIQIVEQAIIHNWKTFYPLTKDKNTKTEIVEHDYKEVVINDPRAKYKGIGA